MDTFWFIDEFGTIREAADSTPPAGFVPVEYSAKPETLKTQQPRKTAILSGDDIRRSCQGYKPMISPFKEKYRWHGISGGLDYHGYCITLGNQWSVMTAPRIDTANIGASDKHIRLITNETFTLAPNASVLAVSAERFIMPRNVMALSFGKSTLARIHIVTTITPIEAGWEGYLTIEISNKNKVSEVDLHAGLPITQLVFFWVTEGSGYDGIYQGQQQVPTPALGNKKS